MTPIERAARNLAEMHADTFERRSPTVEREYADAHWRDYLPEVRAVIAAIREPSEAMLNASTEGQSSREGVARFVWTAMSDALPEEKQNG